MVLQAPDIEAERLYCMKLWNAVEKYTSSSVASILVKWLQQAGVLKEDDAKAAQNCKDAHFKTEITRGKDGALERLGLYENKLPPVGPGPVSCMACVMTSPMQVLCYSAACHVWWLGPGLTVESWPLRGCMGAIAVTCCRGSADKLPCLGAVLRVCTAGFNAA